MAPPKKQRPNGSRQAAKSYLKPSKRAKPTAPATSTVKGKGKAKATEEPAETGLNGRPKRRPDQPKKVKLRDQKVIPVPKTEFASVSGGKRLKLSKVVTPRSGLEDSQSEDEDDEDDVDEEEESDEESDEGGIEDMDLGAETGLTPEFLVGLDKNGLGQSMKETQRLHRLDKSKQQMPTRKREKLRLPSPGSGTTMSDFEINSDDDLDSDEDVDLQDLDMDGELSDSDIGDSDLGSGDEDLEDDDDDEDESEDEETAPRKRKGKGKETEAEYEVAARPKSKWNDASNEEEGDEVEVGRLPIKLPTGEVRQVQGSTRIPLPATKKRRKEPETESESEMDDEEEEDEEDGAAEVQRMAAQKGKFGRMGVAEIVAHEDWRNSRKLEAAKEQIAALGAEILAGGELVDTIPTLTRLSTYSITEVPSPSTSKPIPVPNSIRALALLSQVAVYKDLVPGYRVRQLTEQEEAEKVRDEVKRLREGEKGLVRTYKEYLKILEAEIKQKTPLASLSVKCMCELLSSITHFNFSENIMGVLVGKVGKRSWDEDSDLILQTFISVFRADLTSNDSQTLVRLLARMIKERKFQVHPNILACLLHLRLHSELDQMRGNKKDLKKGSKKNKGKPAQNGDAGEEKVFKSDVRKKWQTKNQKKREKEMKEIQKDLKEAEAEVDKDERAQVQTEILKNLFVLYFSILKHQSRTPLLPAALEGITHFGHFINIEFFRDLLAILRRIVLDQHEDNVVEGEDDPVAQNQDETQESDRIRTRLLAIATAFEILSGQGEALNIDLSEFINALFTLLRPLSLNTGIEDPPHTITSPYGVPKQKTETLAPGRAPPRIKAHSLHLLSTSALLIRCLQAVFYNKYTTQPPWRTAAFIKRMSESALHFPPQTAKSLLEMVAVLMSKEAKLEGMLDTEERMFDGTYKPELDDPQLVNPFSTSMWEVLLLEKGYWEKGVREEAKRVGAGNPNGLNADHRQR